MTAHIVTLTARKGRGLEPVYGLTVRELSGAPPAAVTLWVVEAAAATAAAEGGGGVGNSMTRMASGVAAMRELLCPRSGTPGVGVVIGAVSRASHGVECLRRCGGCLGVPCTPLAPVAQAGMGKTLLLRTIAACHASATLSAEELARARIVPHPPSEVGLVKGAELRDAYRYARVCFVRLRDFSQLDGGASPFARTDVATVADAVAWAVAEQFDLSAAEATPRELSDELLGTAAPRTLWLLDGFDEAPSAEMLARALAKPLQAAFQEARDAKLKAPCDAPAEAAFRCLPAGGIASDKRLEAVLRVLLAQPNVVVSSRPQFEGLLAPLTGRANARYLRLEPLTPEAVREFVHQALKVRQIAAATSSRQPPV